MKTKTTSLSQENMTRAQSSQEIFKNLYPTLFDNSLEANTRAASRDRLTFEALQGSTSDCLNCKTGLLQADASEYLAQLLDILVLEEQKLETFSEVTPDGYERRQNPKSSTSRLEIGFPATKTQAATSQPENQTPENPHKLSELLAIYSSKERMDGDNKVRKDSKLVAASKREVIIAPSDDNADLCIALKRFKTDSRGLNPTKIATGVNLDIIKGASKNPPNPNSTLNQKLLPHQTLDLSEFARN